MCLRAEGACDELVGPEVQLRGKGKPEGRHAGAGAVAEHRNLDPIRIRDCELDIRGDGREIGQPRLQRIFEINILGLIVDVILCPNYRTRVKGAVSKYQNVKRVYTFLRNRLTSDNDLGFPEFRQIAVEFSTENNSVNKN